MSYNPNVLSVPKGGTTGITHTDHGILLGAAANAITSTAELLDGQILIGRTGNTPLPALIAAGANITVTNTPGGISIASSVGTLQYTYTPTAASPYVVLLTDNVIGVDCSGGPKTIKLPDLPTTGRVWTVKDASGTANTNNITVTTVTGAINLDAAATYIINVSYGAAAFIFDGTNYKVL